MGNRMSGKEVAETMKGLLKGRVEVLEKEGITPCLTIIRVGARENDLAYEKGAKKRMELIGILCKVLELPENISQQQFEEAFARVNEDPKVHGILLFRPLPEGLDEEPIKKMIDPKKDVDCMSPVNIEKVFSGDASGNAPCTAQAVMEMFHHYQIPISGKRVTIVGRSMVIGKPLAMMLLKENATVTVCHTKTRDLQQECKKAEILVACAGKAKMITKDMVDPETVVVDVGINVDENGKLCGDVDFENIQEIASYISPVPGGVGSVTTSVLAEHVIKGIEY